MKMIQKVKGHATTYVTIDNEGEEVSKIEAFNFALACAGETPDSLFGYHVKMVDDFAGEVARKVTRVALYTD